MSLQEDVLHLSSPPHVNSFVIGPAVIKHTLAGRNKTHTCSKLLFKTTSELSGLQSTKQSHHDSDFRFGHSISLDVSVCVCLLLQDL